MFDGHYNHWRETRIKKIISIFGESFFKGKTILELGCGWGDVGRYFQTLGAKVTFADGRQKHLDVIKKRDPLSNVLLIDQDKSWNLETTYDIIIHWGVLYHLNHWQQDIKCVINHSNLIFLETEVCDSDDVNLEIKVTEVSDYDQALNKTGTRPSPAMIEKFLSSLEVDYKRYDDSDLNSTFHIYDWNVSSSKEYRNGLRRYWIINKKQ
jgi:hypothetical protein